VAEKAKVEGVRQFIYFSSIYVYGIKSGEITAQTIPVPAENDSYGLSKFQAEELLAPMATESYKVAIVRPPMVYGPQCKGNFPLLVKIAKKTPFIPTIRNKRSMIYIENLAEFLAVIIEQGIGGAFCPQNREYICTAELLENMQVFLGKKPRRMPLMNWFIKIVMPLSSAVQSAFGSLCYRQEMSRLSLQGVDYQRITLTESMQQCLERGDSSEQNTHVE
jgi:UDP-glucose 4-epimerase